MNRFRIHCIFIVLSIFFTAKASIAQEKIISKSFNEAVVSSAINMLPDDIKAKIIPYEANIIKGAVIKQSSAKINAEPVYYINKRTGSGPKMLADQFKLVEKNISGNAADTTTSANMGRIAAYVISLSQPYHTDDTAYLSAAHKEFELKLDASNSAYTASADGFSKVTNPSQYAITLAQKGNVLLAKLKTADASSVESEFFNQAVNSVVDCWLTLLQTPAAKQQVVQNTNPAGGYIGNTDSKKFHMPTCRFLPGDKNRIVLSSREEALNKGFIPCKVCKP